MGISEHKAIPVRSLVINSKNPRFFPVENEPEAILSMLIDQGLANTNKLVELAKDIAENGLNQSEEIVVSPIEDGKYLVREGNRRITAIKLSLDQELLPEGFESLRQTFAGYQRAMSEIEPRCYVTDDEYELLKIIERRHSGPQSGIGIVPWNSEQKSRFNQLKEGRPDRLIALIDQLLSYFEKWSDPYSDLVKIPRTNLGRYLSTPEVRKSLGIELENGVYMYRGGKDDLLIYTLKELGKRRVNDYYYADQRVDLAKSIQEDYMLQCGEESGGIDLQQSLFQESDTNTSKDQEDGNLSMDCNLASQSMNTGFSRTATDVPDQSSRAPVGYASNRTTVVPRNYTMHTMNEARIAAILKELKCLDATQFPNAASLLLRTMIQLCVDKYLASNGENDELRKALSARIEKACQIAVASKSLSNNDVDVLRKAASNNDKLGITVSSLNASAHSASWSAPNIDDLKSLWDGIYKVLALMLDDRSQ